MIYRRAYTTKFHQLFFISVCMAGIIGTNLYAGPLVPAVLIHNQRYGIRDTLRPFVQAGINQFLLCGQSYDETVDIAKCFLESQGAQVAVDSAAYNDDGDYYTDICLSVKSLFPEAKFCLIFDGQWFTHNVDNLLNFCIREQDEQSPVYWVRLATHGVDEDSYKPSLVRCDQQVQFRGIIDPLPLVPSIMKAPTDIYFEWNRIHWGITDGKKIFTDDLEKLLNRSNTKSLESHDVFCLAHVYEMLNDHYKAYDLYMQCSNMLVGDEEDYLSSYRLACLLEKISPGQPDWQLQYRYLLRAHELRPWRAEPLVKIAQHYLHEGNNQLAFLFANQASRLTYPGQDTVAIEHQAYDYTPFDILGITGWYLQEFEIGEQALRRALTIQPWNSHLSQNLEFYVKRKESVSVTNKKRDPRIPVGFGVDFHDSMKHGFAYNYDTIENDPFLQRIKAMYEKYTITDVHYLDTPRIPKIIHQIWLGSELPDKYKAWQKTWFDHHPDWQYWLWSQKDIDELGLKNRAQFDAALTYGEKSDIARYEILYKFGGVYADSDFECIQPMDAFHHCCDFYAGLEGTTAVIGNSIIASAPGHPILKRCIDNLRGAEKGKEGWQYVVDRTGPGHVTACVKAEIMGDQMPTSRIVIFPACYFFPWYPCRPEPRPIENVFKSLRPETFALHLWESSWVK